MFSPSDDKILEIAKDLFLSRTKFEKIDTLNKDHPQKLAEQFATFAVNLAKEIRAQTQS